MPTTIKVKSTGHPPIDAQWAYSPDYMTQISAKTATTLCGMYPKPQIGYATTVAIAKDEHFENVRHRLMVKNISGNFYLACPSYDIYHWRDLFNVEVSR